MRYIYLLLLVSCGSVPSSPCTTWHVSPRFTVEQQSQVEQAAQRWTTVLHADVIKTDRSDHPVCGVQPAVGPMTKPDNVSSTHVVGQYDYALIFLLGSESSDVLELAATHEFGHSLGMQHIDGYGIMSAIQGSPKITESDCAELRRFGYQCTPE